MIEPCPTPGYHPPLWGYVTLRFAHRFAAAGVRMCHVLHVQGASPLPIICRPANAGL